MLEAELLHISGRPMCLDHLRGGLLLLSDIGTV